MLIINADDWGGWKSATDSALRGLHHGAITAVSAMVFMGDSERAAKMALAEDIDVGLHVNFTQSFTRPNCPQNLLDHQNRTSRFLRLHKFAPVLFHPLLRESFRYVYQTQADEFERIYGKQPTHSDGHQHMHLCTNVLLGEILPVGQWVRRSFTFSAGEKGPFNRAYRRWVDRRLSRRFKLTDRFFSLASCLQHNTLSRVAEYARSETVEMMTHPEKTSEAQYLLSEGLSHDFEGVIFGGFSQPV